jgi:hypothetical protein
MHPFIATAIAVEITADRVEHARAAHATGRRTTRRFAGVRGAIDRRRGAGGPAPARPAPVRAGR